jgi:hypothetical protein
VLGQRVAPFNPRTQRREERLQRSVHRSFAIVGISTRGRTTVARLPMSHPDLVSIRCRLAALGSHGMWKRTETEAASVIIAAVRTIVSHLTTRDARAIGALYEDSRGQTNKEIVRWTCRQRF